LHFFFIFLLLLAFILSRSLTRFVLSVAWQWLNHNSIYENTSKVKLSLFSSFLLFLFCVCVHLSAPAEAVLRACLENKEGREASQRNAATPIPRSAWHTAAAVLLKIAAFPLPSTLPRHRAHCFMALVLFLVLLSEGGGMQCL
jgi:hypothetical protein